MAAPLRLASASDDPAHPALLTAWSIVHFAVGVAAHSATLRFRLSTARGFAVLMVLHALYEVKDQTVTAGRNSLVNSFADQAVAALGFLAAALLLGRANTPWVGAGALALAFVLHRALGGSSVRDVLFMR